jgi:hypothetical protein
MGGEFGSAVPAKALLKAAHRDLVTEYVAVWEYLLRAPQDSSTPFLFAMFIEDDAKTNAPVDTGRGILRWFIRQNVGRHITLRLAELRRAYIRLAERVDDDDLRGWLTRTVDSLETLRPTFAAKSPLAAVRASIAAVVSLVTTFQLTKLVTKHFTGKHPNHHYVPLFLLVMVGVLLIEFVLILLTFVVSAFRTKRKLLLGADAPTSSKERLQSRGGKNIYRLEDELFDLVGSGRRAEIQVDVRAWSFVAMTFFFTGWLIPLIAFASTDSAKTYARVGLACFAAGSLVAIRCAFLVRAARRRRWGFKDVHTELLATRLPPEGTTESTPSANPALRNGAA